ncbi:gluconokinase [Shewanella surugensis]|uniref:Gluconokinase n=1 Tax=Shewanella surugensis TaxID=212020 RepID=A0ABT0LFT7_9GAMM|nr:gluconokinase [Shewanella surugensis]MCL1126581.1 gluconokinase [Shewanella surugensis]
MTIIKRHHGGCIIIMGVSSTGKSTIGEALSQAINAKFIDGDDLHPRANILKMASGGSLNDSDRQPWLVRVSDAAFSLAHKSERGVIVCSALKKQYRDIIREGNQNVIFLHLHGSFELITERMNARQHHFMPVKLLQSQFDTLEVPTPDERDVVSISINGTFDQVLARCLSAVRSL